MRRKQAECFTLKIESDKIYRKNLAPMKVIIKRVGAVFMLTCLVFAQMCVGEAARYISTRIAEHERAERGGHYRLRTSSAPVNTERPLSSYPILETRSHQSNDSLQTPNCPKPSGQKFDIHNLEEEIINLQNMIESSMIPSQIKSSDLSVIPSLPCSATVTPSCTPAETSTAHSPTHTENHKKWNNSHPQNATGVNPPPKPPRLYLPREKNFEELNQSNEFDPSAHKVSNQHPNDLLSPDGIPGSQTSTTSVSTVMSPPKPPRQYSGTTKDNLILQIGKLSKSMGNLSDSVETQGKTIPSPSTPQVLMRDVTYAGRQFEEKKEKSSTEHLSVKIGKVFSKFSFRKNTNRRSRDICIGAPTDFKHIARGEADAEYATDDRTLLVSNEQPLSTIKTESKVSSETEETFVFATQKVEEGGEEKGEGGEINSAFTETERDLPNMQVNPIENGSISK
ncbi:hypothetical protein SK128_014296 [Halocaridina rubra]|uniref:Uncharacterized protein n=1 Tax=Halocaridina rubra TaxID=373956 RepID=A0AAN8WWE8_HALRR